MLEPVVLRAGWMRAEDQTPPTLPPWIDEVTAVDRATGMNGAVMAPESSPPIRNVSIEGPETSTERMEDRKERSEAYEGGPDSCHGSESIVIPLQRICRRRYSRQA